MGSGSLLWKGLWKGRSMATIEQRLAKLEAAVLARRPGDDRQQVAMSRLLSLLREALPDDQPRSGAPGLVGLSEYRRHTDKVLALAGRIMVDEISEEDRMLLDGIPHDPDLGMAPAEFITMLAEIDSMY